LERLRHSPDIQRVRQSGKSFAHPLVVLIVLHNEVPGVQRYAVVAGRGMGNAVYRNRAKRVMRVAITSLVSHAGTSVKDGWDIVLLARRPILQKKSQAVQLALEELFQRAKLLNGPV
jgi:ribonuclease P protein component